MTFCFLLRLIFIFDFRFPLDILDDVDYLRGLAWDQRNEEENKIVNRGASEVSVTQQSQLLDQVRVNNFVFVTVVILTKQLVIWQKL